MQGLFEGEFNAPVQEEAVEGGKLRLFRESHIFLRSIPVPIQKKLSTGFVIPKLKSLVFVKLFRFTAIDCLWYKSSSFS
jgi:hypothetical protein